MATELGEGRQAAVCRELTKRFEEVSRGTLAELSAQMSGRVLKGEVVLVVGKALASAGTGNVEEALEVALRDMSVKDAATVVAEALGLPRREVYQAALKLGERE